MKKTIFLFALLTTSIMAFSQSSVEPKKEKEPELELVMTDLQFSKISELQAKADVIAKEQRELLEMIFDANKVDVKKIKTLRVEDRKFLYTILKE